MNRICIIIIMFFCLIMLSGCNENSNKENNTTNEAATSTDSNIESSENQQPLMPKTKEYFENVDRDYTSEDIVNEIGTADGFKGSGMTYYYWILEDGSKAYLWFVSADESWECVIGRIVIEYTDGTSELIYAREYPVE